MSIEQQIIPDLIAETGVTVRMLHAEQLDDLQPADVPLIVLQRLYSDWGPYESLCNIDGPCETTLTADCFAETLVEARRLSRLVRRVMRRHTAAIESEADAWDDGIRVYRVTGSYTVTDYAPEVV
jgi:hypothetical protein